MFPIRPTQFAGLALLVLSAVPLAQAATAPTATTLAATNVASTSARMNGNVSANGAKTSVVFDYGASTAYGASLDATPHTVNASSTGAVSAQLADLSCGTTYYYRVRAANRIGSTSGAHASFTTGGCAPPPPPVAPTATTGSASAISTTQATLNGTATAGSAAASLDFEYGITTAYGSSTTASPASLAAGSAATAMSAVLSNFACGTTYHFRARAQSSVATSPGNNSTFATSACAPPPPPPPPPPSSGIWPWPTWTGQLIAVPPSSTGITYYVDGTAGNDANNGRSATAAFRTIAKAVGLVATGDTVLIRKGLYREGIRLISRSGAAGRPITFGSYGDGEVILDGSTRVLNWTQVSGTVWQAQASFVPIAVVVNEVPLRQVRQGQGGSTAPQEGIAGVTSGSGKWYRGATNLITADFGTTLGSGNPNTADIVVPKDSNAQEHVYWWDSSYLAFKGLTVRGSGSNGLWGYGGNITVENCDIKFNGKAAVSFMASGAANTDNAVLYSHAYHNVLINWPRGNNGFAEAGGAWPGALAWHFQLRPVARGNIVHMNGGEGILSYGSSAGATTGSALFEQNVAYDNWSVNLYFDNQPNNVARSNYLFNHPANSSNWLYDAGYPYSNLGKYAVCLMIADEQNSSDGTGGYANLRGTQVYNNVIAGCRIGIREYAEGSQSTLNHGLKDTVIANNTIVMGYYPVPNASTYGIYLMDNRSPSGTQRNVNSVIQNNVVYGFNQDSVIHTELTGAQGGASIDYNLYYSAAPQPFSSGYSSVARYNFAGWKAATPGSDANSGFQDPLLVDPVEFRTFGSAVWDYNKADVIAGSPTLGTGAPQAFTPSVNFRGVPRVGWSIGAF